MNDQDSAHASAMFVHAVNMAAFDITRAHTRPSVVFRPSLSVDGDQYCALFGEDLQVGVCGFGDTPEAAMADFDRNWFTPLGNPDIGNHSAA